MIMKKNNLVKIIGLDVNKCSIMGKSTGRVIHNHAVMYILKGQGFFEDANTIKQRVTPGTIFYLYPDKWHHFDPDPGTAWTEYWVVFDGYKTGHYFGNLIPESKSIYRIGMEESIIETYEELYDIWFYHSPCYYEYSSLFNPYSPNIRAYKPCRIYMVNKK